MSYSADSLLTSPARGTEGIWATALARHGADQPATIAGLYFRDAPLVGLNADLALAQAVHECSWFTSRRWLEQRNAAGIGITSADVPGIIFSSPEVGIRAHLAHLCCYVYTEATCPIFHANTTTPDDGMRWSDPRHHFHDGKPALRDLIRPGVRSWAVPGTNYVAAIARIANEIAVAATQPTPATSIAYDLDLRSSLTRNPQGGPSERVPLSSKRGGVVVHYTGGGLVPESEQAQLVALGSYAQYHALTKDWSNEPGDQLGDGIMYHLAILRSGKMALLRDLEESLWHCGTARNRTAFSLLVMIGVGQRATAAQLVTARRACDALLALNALARSEARGHQEESATSCPGTLMDDFIRPYRSTGGSPINLDAALEAHWRANQARLGGRLFAGLYRREWAGEKILVCEKGILAAAGDGVVTEITRRAIDDWATYTEADGSLTRY